MKQISWAAVIASCTLSLTAASLITSALAQAPPPSAAPQSGRPQGARPVSTVGSQGYKPVHADFTKAQIEAGNSLFLQNCAFCHGKDAGGGESGPDLTRSKLVSSDKNGEAIGAVLRNGRQEKGMPRFALPDTEIMALVAYVHSQQDLLMSQTGTRKGVDESDLQTGNAQAGKQYFDGVGGCAKCHSATGDLAGVATRFSGLKLEQQMLYPADVKSKVAVKTATGQSFNGVLEYQDEFTIGMRDSFGQYHSWPTTAITYKVDDPAEAHVVALSKYTDNDIHNVLAYVQTLK
ncbi:MAG: c-type cytochrome [Janthinobacterium lividum]